MANKIMFSHTLTGEKKAFDVVDKEYVLRAARVISEDEAVEVLLDEYHSKKKEARYDFGVNLETGALELNTVYNDMYIGFNLFIPLVSLDVRDEKSEFFSWIDDDLDALKAYLDSLYKPVSK